MVGYIPLIERSRARQRKATEEAERGYRVTRRRLGGADIDNDFVPAEGFQSLGRGNLLPVQTKKPPKPRKEWVVSLLSFVLVKGLQTLEQGCKPHPA